MNSRLLLFAAVLALCAPGSAAAMPMPDGPVKLRNADGTTVTGYLHGDEFLSWATDAEGHAIAYDKLTGTWNYAKAAKDGRLVPTTARVGKVDARRLKLPTNLRPSGAALKRALDRRQKALPPASIGSIQTTGNLQMLVVLVKFQCPIPAPTGAECLSSNTQTTFQPTDFAAVFNGATGSVKDYFRAASAGKLTMDATIYPSWIPLAHNDVYYAYNETTDETTKVSEMLKEVVDYLDAQKFNFAPYADASGNIRAIGIIHVGPSYEDNPNNRLIHSHQMQIGAPLTTWDGKKIFGYHTEPEVHGTKITPIGVIAHETGHALGLPDLYDTMYMGAGLGDFSLMAAGSWGGPARDATVPVLPDAWSRKALGWTTPTRIVATTPGLRLKPAATSTDAVLLPSGMPPNQYFLLENRTQVGYDQYLPGSGLAVYLVDDDMADNTPPSSSDHYRVTLVEADGDYGMVSDPQNPGAATDLFPSGSTNALTPTSVPNSRGYGLAASQISVTSIARAAPDVTFDVGIAPYKLELGFTCAGVGDCKSGFCVDGVCCNELCNAGPCDACSRAMGSKLDGSCQLAEVPCNDGDGCTENDMCSAGKCAGVPKVCLLNDSCHQPAVCNPATGVCSNVALADGTSCDDKDDCTAGDTCKAGVCGGSAITECPAPDQCHSPTTCTNKKCGLFAQKPDNTPCNDSDQCTTGDACLRGTCKGTPVVCNVPNDCYQTATCDPGTGTCPQPVMRPEGSSCDDKNACTKDDSCGNGLCRGTVDPTVTTCPPPDLCHEGGTCSAQGECVAPLKPDGTSCDDGNKCIRNQKCLAGVCKGVDVVCNSTDPCYDYQCVPSSGMCTLRAKAEGAVCVSENPCEVNSSCRAGACKGDPMACPAADECHTGGTCNRMTGKCGGAGLAPDGKRCTGGSCVAGVCVPDPVDAGSGGGEADGGGGGETGKGCGCATSGAAPLAFLALLVLPAIRRRRA